MRALTFSFCRKKKRKRSSETVDRLPINAAARMNDISYSKLMYGLKLAGVEVNRKMLSENAIYDAEGLSLFAESQRARLLNKAPDS